VTRFSSALVFLWSASLWCAQEAPLEAGRLKGTEPLDWPGDLASRLVDAADRFLLERIDHSVEERERHWPADPADPESVARMIEGHRRRLSHILGVRDARPGLPALELIATTDRDSIAARSTKVVVHRVRWRAFADVHAEGLLLEPVGRAPVASLVAIPDADSGPETIAGLGDPSGGPSAYALHLAKAGCRVLVPALISRTITPRGAQLSHREFLYRSAFELGRHILGYEIQKVLAAVDWLETRHSGEATIGVVGYGEGGLVALYSAALDPRIDGALVSGCFSSMHQTWQEPIDRNVFGLLQRFGGAELCCLVWPRALVIETAPVPKVCIPAGLGGAPGAIVEPSIEEVGRELKRAQTLARALGLPAVSTRLESGDGETCSPAALQRLLEAMGVKPFVASDEFSRTKEWLEQGTPEDVGRRLESQIHEIDRHNQRLLGESAAVRARFMERADSSSVDKYRKTIEPYREILENDVIGRFDRSLSDPRPRSRECFETDKVKGLEVVLDVFDGLFAYGILLLPKDLRTGERRPVVVCQHGLEGRPQDVIQGDHWAYHDFATRLCERGFITFAPQNLYIFGDRFRTLQRKANLLGCTLFSLIIPQHRQILRWLAAQPFVDKDRIAFYGLSYGGKTAMRVPAVMPEYCLSICSADFNEWVWKNASTQSPYSYVWSGEYEIFEFDLGSTFNYAEMAALIAPRPFMVERGHFDGVAPDETVAFEFAKVQNLYHARLGLTDGHCAIEWFVGPHTIHGVGTFEFLDRHLAWPRR